MVFGPNSTVSWNLPAPSVFLIAAIKISEAAIRGPGCLMNLDHKYGRSFAMKSEFPFNPAPEKRLPIAPAPSRFIDEKISDESGTETKASESALAPAGLKNPFWN